MNKNYFAIKKAVRENNIERIRYLLSRYHENDIADILKTFNAKQRKKVYEVLGPAKTAEVFSYFDSPEKYVKELSIEKAAQIISNMYSDDAVNLLEALNDEDRKKITSRLEKSVAKDVEQLLEYEENEIGGRMTNNYVRIQKGLSVCGAMNELVSQAGVHDNIMTIYVVDGENRLVGAIDLKKLITARQNDRLEDITVSSYPYVKEHEKIGDCMKKILDYAEDSIPVVDEEKRLLGVITAESMVEIVDDEMGEEYAKLAGLTAEEDLNETAMQSVKKRIPWLTVLLILGTAVSSVVGIFENVAAALPVIICFQSLVLDMAGNVGTQSLAVTIRVLTDSEVSGKQKASLIFKELKVGLINGGLLGILSFFVLGGYICLSKGYGLISALSISGCVGISLLTAMTFSSLVGTVIPMIFKKIKIDPAVASGPLITTVNDLVAVVTYYGLSYIFLVRGKFWVI